MALFLRGLWIVYQKLEKPCVWFNVAYEEYYTHLGKEEFFAWNEYGGFELSLENTGNRNWNIAGNEDLLVDAVVVLGYPLMKWS